MTKRNTRIGRKPLVRCLFARQEKDLRCSLGWILDSLWEQMMERTVSRSYLMESAESPEFSRKMSVN